MVASHTHAHSLLGFSARGLSSLQKRDNNEAWLRSRSAKPDSRDSIVRILFKWPFMPVATGVGKVCLTCFSSGGEI